MLVAAAFIGPGTVTTCTLAGAQFGTSLLWALGFATLATIVFQEMAARLGAGANMGLGEALLQTVRPGSASRVLVLWPITALVFVAIAVGNSAYQAGNLAGGALGLQACLDDAVPSTVIVAGLTVLAGGLLTFGGYRWIERTLIAIVCVMGLCFASTAWCVRPDVKSLLRGCVPDVAPENLWSIAALVGTTVVPYNLFLHAAAAKRRFRKTDVSGEEVASLALDESERRRAQRIGDARWDTIICVTIGGAISSFIVISASAISNTDTNEVESAVDLAKALEPVFGSLARYLIGTGLLAAGLTSAITAPMATGYVLSELLPLQNEKHRTLVFKTTCLLVLIIGCLLNALGIKPVVMIVSAQVANGLLLPVIACVLLWVMNQKRLLGNCSNGIMSNLLGFVIVLVATGLGARLLVCAW